MGHLQWLLTPMVQWYEANLGILFASKVEVDPLFFQRELYRAGNHQVNDRRPFLNYANCAFGLRGSGGNNHCSACYQLVRPAFVPEHHHPKRELRHFRWHRRPRL